MHVAGGGDAANINQTSVHRTSIKQNTINKVDLGQESEEKIKSSSNKWKIGIAIAIGGVCITLLAWIFPAGPLSCSTYENNGSGIVAEENDGVDILSYDSDFQVNVTYTDVSNILLRWPTFVIEATTTIDAERVTLHSNHSPEIIVEMNEVNAQLWEFEVEFFVTNTVHEITVTAYGADGAIVAQQVNVSVGSENP